MKRIFGWSVAMSLVLGCALAQSHAGEQKIEWSRNVFASFQKSCAEKKPLAVLFVANGTEFSRKLDREVLDDPQMHALADRAVFVWADANDEDTKGNYERLKKTLSIDRYPVLVVLDANEQRLEEAGRISGYFPRDTFLSHFDTILKFWKSTYASAPEAPPTPRLPDGWKTFRSTNGRFEVAMPGEPEPVMVDDDVKQYVFVSATPDQTRQAAVQAIEVAEVIVRDLQPTEILRNYADVLSRGLPGELCNVQNVEWNGYPSMRFQIEAANAARSMTVQSTLVGKRLYLVTTSGVGTGFEQADFTTLINTFKVIDAEPVLAALPTP